MSTEKPSGFEWTVPLATTGFKFPDITALVPLTQAQIEGHHINPQNYAAKYLTAFSPGVLSGLLSIRHPARVKDPSPIYVAAVSKLSPCILSTGYTDDWSAWMMLMPVRVS